MEHSNSEHPDVFISYAHADDEAPFGVRFGWVTTFVEELKKRLRSKLGNSGANVWMDWQLHANDQVTEMLMDKVNHSRVLVLFMSPGYVRSQWCRTELGNFLERNQASKNRESVFIVELDRTEREAWHRRLQELTPLRLWREDLDGITETLGIPVPKPDQDDPYWRNLNKLAHLIAEYLKRDQPPIGPAPLSAGIVQTDAKLDSALEPKKPTVWIAEPTDDLIDQWEMLAEGIIQSGARVLPLGLDTYPRRAEAEYRVSVRAELSGSDLFVQLLGQVPGRRPKDGQVSFTALQAELAAECARQSRVDFLRWRNREINLEDIADGRYRQLLTGAVACGFEEFRQRVLTRIADLNKPLPAEQAISDTVNELAICVSADKADRDLGFRIRDILLELGTDALTTPTEPYSGQTPTDFNAQLDEVMLGSQGVIIVYGQSSPAWVQAQYVRARKVLSQQRKGIWGALLDGPPRDKPDVGVASRNLMMLDCREGPQRRPIERFVDALRGAGHA
ncbi:toll/interleukin-1 receptor domain-containing protein [Methylomonas sp. MgM2]